ncbi:MAG: type II toxin-antitoxin system VapC family toxin [Verrucomicrobia bacterium]|nr:type II toxin-antitoxin system VapC family toxin [Verrucomicrobiota bacterium]
MVHFDTNFLIEVNVVGSAADTKFRMWSAANETFGICSVAWAEFLCGPLDATAAAFARQIFPHPEPFLSADALQAADLFNQTGRRSRSLPDCMIAAVAIRCDARLATNNLADFEPLLPFGLVFA